MALLEWSESFRVGVGTLDEEHKALFRLMNGFYQHVLEGTAGDASAGVVLDRLVTYTQDHFQHEEDMLRMYGYPEHDEHVRLHQRLWEQIGAFRATSTHKKGLSLELSRFMLDWVLQHILKDDIRYRDFLLSKGVR